MDSTDENSSLSAVGGQGAALILDAFDAYQDEFKAITRRAKTRFELRDGHGAQQDALERLELYPRRVSETVSQIKGWLGTRTQDHALWVAMKNAYTELVTPCNDLELAQTFFNSITRRIFITVGVDPQIEFLDKDFYARPPHPEIPIYHTYLCPGQDTAALKTVVAAILASYPFEASYWHLDCDLDQAAQALAQRAADLHLPEPIQRVEVLTPVFFRNNCAYLIGRLCFASPRRCLPLVLCLVHHPEGIAIDSLLTDEDDVSIVFSFTRSYFHVEVEVPHQLISFLKSIIPLKRIAELYIAIGYNKHGKTELYYELMQHLANTHDQFRIAPGERGMVMIVFILDSLDLAFKVIKDRIDPPKTTTRQEVMARYDLVFKHDRAGRLIDAQEFEFMRFDRERFDPALLAELVRVAPKIVSVESDCVVFKHLYVERRLTPLDLYVRTADETQAQAAVVDYGQAIKDMAASNIFPGDVLLKNFGVTRHGRVVFYDYDELCLLSDCHFRKVPEARSYDDEMESEPWFYVGPMDIFPEEFRTFLGLQEPLRSIFTDAHGDLFGVAFWKGLQRRLSAGEIIDIFPYPENRRLSCEQPG